MAYSLTMKMLYTIQQIRHKILDYLHFIVVEGFSVFIDKILQLYSRSAFHNSICPLISCNKFLSFNYVRVVCYTLNQLKFISTVDFLFKVVLPHNFGGVYLVFFFMSGSLDDSGASFPNGLYVFILSNVVIYHEKGLDFVRLTVLHNVRRQAIESIVVCLFHHIAFHIVIILFKRKVAINC